MRRGRSEIVQRLKIAQERTREGYEQTFKGHDAHPGTDIAGAWPFITAAYSGIEQTFKFQIAEANRMTVEELVATRSPKDAKGERRFPYRHHNLGKLFNCLEAPIRNVLAEQYRRFRTLHPYIGPATAGEFLDAVSTEDGRGYERWRYSLTAPEEKIPTNSADALLSIWDVAVQLCETDREGWRLRGVYEHLSEGFAWALQDTMRRRMERMESGEEYQELHAEAMEWMRARGGLLNAYSELVHRAHRGLVPDPEPDGLSSPLADCLTRWLEAGDVGVVKARSDVGVFLARAAGRRGPARGVRWNGETNGFEDVPWDLCETTAAEPPEGAFRFDAYMGSDDRLREIKWILKRGFRAAENYPFREQMPRDKWLCTLCAEKPVDGDKLTIRFWEHRDDENGFYVDVEGAEESKEGRLVRKVVRLDSENTLGEGAYIVESADDS